MRYRLLNEPGAAESICLDMLQIDPDNQQALVTLFARDDRSSRQGLLDWRQRIQEVLGRLRDEYQRTYYTGIVWEGARRRGLRKAHRARTMRLRLVREAMEWFEKAEAIRPAETTMRSYVGTPAHE